MILAYTYPKFKEYENLRGQFGTGIDNCLLDFATFPGAILVTKHALENIEYLYRGRLFTTEKYNPKGVIKIEDNNFEPLIKSSMEAKGFKTGKERPKIKIGYNDLELETLFSNLLKEKNQYKNVFIMGAGAYTVEQKLYFEKIINLLPQDVFLISLTYPTKTKNSVYINATGDFYFLYKSTDFIRKFLPESKITIFLGKYDKHTLSNIIKLKKNNADNIFMSKCSPMIMNPRVMNILNSTFKIKQITNANQDLNLILDNT